VRTTSPVQNGPSPTAPELTTNTNALVAVATVLGATTPPTDASLRRLNNKRVVGKKAAKKAKLVQQGEKEDSQKELGASDAQREIENEQYEATAPVVPQVVLPILEVPLGMPKDLIRRVKSDLLGVDFAEVVDTKPLPIKRLYEKYCAFMLTAAYLGKVVVIGRESVPGCHLRHHIQSSDDVGVDADCDCDVGSFCRGCGNACRYILVDVIDRFGAQDVADILLSGSKPQVYSVQYEYRASRGGHHVAPGGEPEIRWERFSGGLLVEDSQHVGRYVKSPADWTTTGACIMGKKGKRSLCWNVVSIVGDCRVVRYFLVKTPLAAHVEKDPLSDSYYGDTTPDQAGLSDPRAVDLQAVVGPITQMYSAGDMFYCEVGAKQILVPKQGIGYIALWAAGKPRDQRTYSDAFNQARQWVKTTRLNTMEKADCLPYIVAFGLLRTLATEAKAIGVLGDFCQTIASHNDALTEPFAPPPGVVLKRCRHWLVENQRWVKPLLALGTSGAAVVLGMLARGRVVSTMNSWHALWTKMFAPKITFWSLCKALVIEGDLGSKVLAAQTMLGQVRSLSAAHRLGMPMSVLTSLFGLGKLAFVVRLVSWIYSWFGFWTKRRSLDYFQPATSPWWFVGLLLLWVVASLCKRRAPGTTVAGPLLTYCAKGRPLKEMREGAKCSIRHVDVPAGAENADVVDCAVTEGPFHIGLGIAGHIPVIARHCVHNDLVAVRNRGICKRSRASPGWWRTIGRYRMFALFGRLWPVIATPYEDWVSRYPGSKQRQLRAALGDVVTDYYYAVKRKAFTKMECAEKRADIDVDEPYGTIVGYDPRLIQGCYPIYVNATGPFAHAFSKACKGEHGDTTYGPGLNAEALDEWLEMAEMSFNEPVAYMDSDAVRLDASVEAECVSVTTELYGYLGADDEAMRMFEADVITHGATSHGVTYRVPGTVPSGKTTTTCGNTASVITVVEEALQDIPHKAIVAGDDAAILVPLRLVVGARQALLKTGCDAGFEFKIKASRIRVDMEFCSGRWWPAATRAGFAFGPKPGKLLPKLFFASSRNSVGSRYHGYCQAICIGMLPTVSHLPVAYEFVQQVSKITNGYHMHKVMRERLVNRDLQNVRRSHPVQPSPEIWEAYTHVYGISQGECQQAIARIREVEAIPDLVQHPIFDSMVAQDAPAEVDPESRDPGIWQLASNTAVLANFSLFRRLSWMLGAFNFFTPFGEEVARHRWPVPVTIGLLVVEGLACWRRGIALRYYLPATGIHLAAFVLHLAGRPMAAVSLHYLGNFLITLVNWYRHGRGRLAYGNIVSLLFGGASRPKSLTNRMQQIALPQRQRNQRQRGAMIPLPPPRPPTFFPSSQRRRPKQGRRRRNRNKNYDRISPNSRGVGVLGAPGPTGYQGKTKGTIVEGDEFIVNVDRTNGENFETFTLPINPGLAHVFPILCNQARIYEKYNFEQLEFYWVPKVTEFAAGTGQTAFMIDYDAKDPVPSTIRVMLNNDPHTEAMPHMQYGIRCDPSALRDGAQRFKYVRTSDTLPTGGDLKTYDGGVAYFGFSGTPDSLGTATLGELHVRYRIHLLKQQIEFDQGEENSPPRNYVYSNITSSIENAALPIADSDSPTWANLDMFQIYWDLGVTPQGVAATTITPYSPGQEPQIAFGNIATTGTVSLPEGRFLIALGMYVNANDNKNLDYFRIRFLWVGEDDNNKTFPAWEPFATITEHTVTSEFAHSGANLNYVFCVPGGREFSLQYQLSTEDDVGAGLYVNLTVAAL
jgi:hypothetical protein